MKLFTAFRAVGLAGLIVVLAGECVVAQDVTVTDPQWFDPAPSAAYRAPVFKNRPNPGYPPVSPVNNQPGYVLVAYYVSAAGEFQRRAIWSSHAFFRNEHFWERGVELSPAMKDGEPTDAVTWFAVLFNPKYASLTGDAARPRMLAVAPVIVTEKELQNVPGVRDHTLTVWANVQLDDAGVPHEFSIEKSAYEKFRPGIKKALESWRFAPARENGKPVAADFPVAFAVMVKPAEVAHVNLPPSPIFLREPVYPAALKKSGLPGEVVVSFTVDHTGKVSNASVVWSSHPGFEAAALEAIYKWRFKPAQEKGQPVSKRIQVPLLFKLVDDFANGSPEERPPASARERRQRHDVGSLVQNAPYPAYPYELLVEKIGGEAHVRCVVDENGRVVELEVTKADKVEFGEALAAATAAFEFAPLSPSIGPAMIHSIKSHRFDPSGASGHPPDEDIRMLSVLRKSPEKILSAKNLDAPLRVVATRRSVFPPTAKGSQGSAVIEIVVDEEGRAALPRIVKASEPVFGYAAAHAVGEWSFEPPRSGGKPAIVRVMVPVNFTRADQETPVAPKAETAAPPTPKAP